MTCWKESLSPVVESKEGVTPIEMGLELELQDRTDHEKHLVLLVLALVAVIQEKRSSV